MLRGIQWGAGQGPAPNAVTALARKMVGILWAMWTKEKDYDPTLGADIIA
jgi:hypothetical protein